MTVDELLTKRLIFVTGKGGVGKTTVSTLLALTAAAQKKKTLLVEMNSTGRIAPQVLTSQLDVINLRPKICFEEYVLRQIRFKTIYDVLFNNSFVTNFISAVPGLSEILMLGKIYDLENQRSEADSDTPLYDLIIVDTPATGHGLSLLEVPNVLISTVKTGPLQEVAIKINKLLKDAASTAFCLVTLAEEMPVTETQEYADKLKKYGFHFGPLFINAVIPQIQKIKKAAALTLPTELKPYLDSYNLVTSRHALQKKYIDKITREFPVFKKVLLPYEFKGLKTHSDFSSLLEAL